MSVAKGPRAPPPPAVEGLGGPGYESTCQEVRDATWAWLCQPVSGGKKTFRMYGDSSLYTKLSAKKGSKTINLDMERYHLNGTRGLPNLETAVDYDTTGGDLLAIIDLVRR